MAQALYDSQVATIGESRVGSARLVAAAAEAGQLDMAKWLVKNGARIDGER